MFLETELACSRRALAGTEEGEMIQLGSFDTTVTQAQRAAYLQQATAISGGRGDLAAEGRDKLAFAPYAPEPQQPMTVANMQQALKSIGFFPGGKVDSICGYRTRAAMRLFQEYVRFRSRSCRVCRTAASDRPRSSICSAGSAMASCPNGRPRSSDGERARSTRRSTPTGWRCWRR